MQLVLKSFKIYYKGDGMFFGDVMKATFLRIFAETRRADQRRAMLALPARHGADARDADDAGGADREFRRARSRATYLFLDQILVANFHRTRRFSSIKVLNSLLENISIFS